MEMKQHFIRIITASALFILLALQVVWLYHSYMFVKTELSNKASIMLEQAIMDETFNRTYLLPVGTWVEGRSINDIGKNIPEFVYMQESLEKLNVPLSLDTLNTFYKTILNANNFPNNCSFSILKGDSIIEEKATDNTTLLSIETNKIPLRKDYSIVIQARLYNPYQLYYDRIGGLLVSTTLLVILIIGCIIYQILIVIKQRRIMQIREDFSYALIHDMKSPLSTIFTTLNFLHSGRMDGKPEMKEKYFQIAEEEADKLLKLTNKVLTISKLEKQKMEMRLSCVALAPMLERLIEKFKAKSEKSLRFALDLKVPTVTADEEYLEEVFRNLIDNAVKYSNKEEVEISITSETDKAYTVIRVHDNGMGIAQKHLPNVFNKYERGAASKRIRKGGATGFGLGLNFVQQIIEAHHGKVFANSIENEFTEIIIYLPNQLLAEEN
ncbi:MAG: HAMP domain-containing histidine kinase [Mediterranea massiliensis]|nr:HAMP domain-containing histidine kinase [Mediterranea massiliensis]